MNGRMYMIKFYTWTLLILTVVFSYYALVIRKTSGAATPDWFNDKSISMGYIYTLGKPDAESWYDCANECRLNKSHMTEFSWTTEEDLYIITCKCKKLEDDQWE